MINKLITIGKIKKENKNSKSKISSLINYDDKTFELWLEVPLEYEDSLCDTRADGFLIALLPWLMMKSKEHQVTIKTMDPISLTLYSNIVDTYIPLLTKNISYYSPIIIERNVTSESIDSKNYVGTGVSCGVDSSYTIAKYSRNDSCFPLTHLIYYSMGIYGGLDSKSDFALIHKAEKISSMLKLPLIIVRSNFIMKLYNKAYAPIVPFVFMGSALCLQKYFSRYYYSSGYTTDMFCISPIDAAHFDLLSVKAFSNGSLNFYSAGISTSRYEKVRYITDYPFTYDNLTVCLKADQSMGNCGRCAKCSRTMAELDSMGKLDLYHNSFDINDYRRSIDYHWGYILLKKNTDAFCMEILNNCKKNGYKIHLSSYFAAMNKWIRRGFTSKNKKHEMINKYYNSTPEGE